MLRPDPIRPINKRSHMDTRTRDGLIRLILGIALNVGLWFVFERMNRWSSVEREFRLAFLGGSLAAVTAGVLLPVFWRGAPWQAPVALAFLWLPGSVLYLVLLTLLKYW